MIVTHGVHFLVCLYGGRCEVTPGAFLPALSRQLHPLWAVRCTSVARRHHTLVTTLSPPLYLLYSDVSVVTWKRRSSAPIWSSGCVISLAPPCTRSQVFKPHCCLKMSVLADGGGYPLYIPSTGRSISLLLSEILLGFALLGSLHMLY